MKYSSQIHHRRSIRLRGYDYSQAGAYFITVCTHNRELSLENEPMREAVCLAWHVLPLRFPCVALDEFVIMPNHVHGILVLKGAASSAPTLGHVIRAFKSISAIEANRASGRVGQPLWQRNYYEHVIRDEDELNAVRQYVRENPLKWAEDPDNPSIL
jgi:putative transposase